MATIDDGSRAGPRDSVDSVEMLRVAAKVSSFSLVEREGRAGSFGSWRRLGMDRSTRAEVVAAIGWLPLAVLIVAQRRSTAIGALSLFARDYPVHVRTLFAIPLLVMIAPFVDRRFKGAIRRFIDCALVKRSELPAFERAIDHAERLRDSRWVPWVLLAVAITGSVFSMSQSIGATNANWTTSGVISARSLTPAGWWYVAVSVPMFQLLVLQWLWRWFIWRSLLWRFSRLDLQLIPTHADRAAGLGFLGGTAASFGFVLLGPSALVSASWVDRMLNHHVPIERFFGPMIGVVVLVLAFVLSPLTVFWPRLRRIQQAGASRYAVLVQRYNRRFDRKWTGPAAPGDEEALGALDAQNMADLANVYDIVAHTRFLPFEPQAMADLAVAVLLPMLPLLLAATSPQEILKRILNALL